MAQQLTLSDGRIVDYQTLGDPNGFPLVFIHGTPGSYPVLTSSAELAKRKGVKIITQSRAGYGGSSRWKGRRIVDAVTDIDAVLKHLGVTKCVVAGWSGGGNHAIACAARLPGCAAALSIAGCGPYGVEDLDFLAGQGEDNVLEFEATLKGEVEVTKFCTEARSGLYDSTAEGLTEAMSSILPEVDKKAMRNSEMGPDLVTSFNESLKNGVDGWVDDDLACIEPWGFELSEVKVPVMIYQGSEDLMVPFAHGKWLAEHLPQDKVKKYLLEGEGHISIFLDHMENMIDELVGFAK